MLCQGQSLMVYTDSRYAFGVVHVFRASWKMRGFLTSTGKPISHGPFINDLLEAILLPFEIAVCKCTAQTHATGVVSQGNGRADTAAKSANSSSTPPLQLSLLTPTDVSTSFSASLSDSTETQSKASQDENA